jgi:phosphocarrier protein HPr
MTTATVTVTNPSGIHTRPAAMLVQLAARFACDFTIGLHGYVINGKSILGVLTLAAEQGAELELTFEGPDETEACAALVEFFRSGLHE